MSDQPIRFVTAGGLRLDYLITHDDQVHLELPGGNALYAAVGAALWSDRIGLLGRIGANYPSAWLENFAAQGLATAGLITLPDEQDHRTFFAYGHDDSRDDTNPAHHFARLGQPLPEALHDYIHSTPGQDDPHHYEPLAVQPVDWPEAYGGATAVHLSPHSLRTHLTLPPFLKEKYGCQVTVDPGERYMVPDRIPYLRQLLPQVDAFLPSIQEVESLFGPATPIDDGARQLLDWGAACIVVKAGSEGVCLYQQSDRERHHLPAFHSADDPRITDVTGAGDAFCGGFMVGLQQYQDPVTAAQLGLISASLVIEGYGAFYAFSRDRAEAQQRLDDYQSLHHS